MSQRGGGPDPPPREVVARAKEGSAEARARLIDHYYQPVRTFLRRQTGDPERSDDLAHDTFVYALAHLDELDRDTSFRAWLYRIACSMAAQEWRRPERGRTALLTDAAEVLAAAPSSTDELVRNALAELSPAQREALEGHGMYGESISGRAPLVGVLRPIRCRGIPGGLRGAWARELHYHNPVSRRYKDIEGERMDYTHLGRTGLQVSRLCLGTMNFGPQTSEADSFKIMERAHEHGINFFDTANVYGWKQGEGVTEQIVGRWFAQGGGRREKTVIATKLYGTMSDWPNGQGVNALTLKRECEASLRRLQTDYIDIYQMHHIPRGTPWEEIWQGMETLVREGKILYAASSNFAGWQIAQANETARQRHFMGLVSEQSLYNLNARMVELEVIPACEAYGLGLIPWSPLGAGMLGGALRKASEGRRSSEQVTKQIEANRPKLEAYEGLCRDLGEQPADVALAWLLRNPVVTAPITGPRTLEQLDNSLHALDIKLSDETLDRLEEIFPGPGKGHGQPAPEAYAW